MTREAVIKVVQRAISDGAFRTQLTRDSATALRGFDLTPAEAAAIRSGDSGRISALGVDLRMSKAFTLAATDGRADSILTTGTDSSLASGVNSGTNSSLTTGTDSGLASGVNSGTNSSLTTGTDSSLASGVNSGTNSSLTGGEGAMLDAGSNAAITTGGAGGTRLPVDMIDQGAVSGSGVQTGESQGTQVVQWDGNDDAPLSTVIPGEPAHAFGAQTPEGSAFGNAAITADEGYLTSVNYASSSGQATDEGQITNALNSEGGAGSVGEAGDDPNIQP